MAITGLTLFTQAPAALTPSYPDVDEAVGVTVELLVQLGVVRNEQSLRESLHRDYQRLAELGSGRLYVELPTAISFDELIALANELAQKAGYPPVDCWEPFWVPGTEKESVTENELNSDAASFNARIALFAKDSKCDPLLHFMGLPYDNKHARRKEATQLNKIKQTRDNFAAKYAGASLRPCGHRDFMVWYLMDLIRQVPVQNVVLARGWMRVPALGRRDVDGSSLIARVSSHDGGAGFYGDGGQMYNPGGIGLSAGFRD